MTVEEIKAMCNSVMNASKQMDNDYIILKGKEKEKNTAFSEDFENTLSTWHENYIESGAMLMKKVSKLMKGYRRYNGLSLSCGYIFAEENFYTLPSGDRKIMCAFTSRCDKKGDYVPCIAFATDYTTHELGCSIKAWNYNGDLSPFFITTYDLKARSAWTRDSKSITLEETINRSADKGFPLYDNEKLMDDLQIIMRYGEAMIQKLIAKISQVILDLSAERNKAVTDRL